MTEPSADAPDSNPIPLSAFLASLAAVIAVIAAVAFLGLRDDDGDAAPGTVALSPSAGATDPADPAAQPTDPGAPVPQPPAGGTAVGPCTFVPDGTPSRPVTLPTEADLRTGAVTATLETSAGAVTLSLDGAKAPCATASFVSLARQGFYDGTPCHRIIDGSDGGPAIAQCGDPDGTGMGGPGYAYAEENLEGATYPRGTIAMAKTAAPSSTGSQFFLVTRAFDLPPEYTVLGTITGGLEALDSVIGNGVKPGTEMGPGDGAPLTPLQIERASTAG